MDAYSSDWTGGTYLEAKAAWIVFTNASCYQFTCLRIRSNSFCVLHLNRVGLLSCSSFFVRALHAFLMKRSTIPCGECHQLVNGIVEHVELASSTFGILAATVSFMPLCFSTRYDHLVPGVWCALVSTFAWAFHSPFT